MSQAHQQPQHATRQKRLTAGHLIKAPTGRLDLPQLEYPRRLRASRTLLPISSIASTVPEPLCSLWPLGGRRAGEAAIMCGVRRPRVTPGNLGP
jgi:hypothetical protein